VGLEKYIKKAFLFHWNLLAFLGGMGFAVLSGYPAVAVPLILAAETAYLGFIGTHPRFQRFIDAQEHKSARAQTDAEAVQRLAKSLPPAQFRRFQALRDRCLALRQIAEQMPEPGDADSLRSLDELQLSDLDRLLWIYLRMLYTQHMLERFFENTSADQIQAEIRRLEDRIRRLEKEPDSANRSRIRQSSQANLETCNARLSNLMKARENHELLQAEIENLETKIQSITELAINRGDAAAITGQVEQITQGLIRTEQTINDLGFATGAEAFDLTVPTILSRQVTPPTDVEPEPPPRRRQRENEIRFP
jgi:chemotaxis protein histidine kinase CheA